MGDTNLVSSPLIAWISCDEEVQFVSLGKKLKQLRQEKGWSQDEFAFNAQIDGRQVSRYENDRVMPSVDVIIKMAKAFNVSLDYLLIDNMNRRPIEPITSKLVQRVLTLNGLTEEDENSLLHIIDAIEAKNKLKSLAAGVQ
jgi:transcriptional regulator with XRE-family HTH domain